MPKNNSELRKILLLVTIIALTQELFAQSTPYSVVYDDTMVNSIYITIDPDSLEEMFDNLENEYEYAVQFIYDSPVLKDTLENVGFRLRGNTSLFSAKKSFKISFNTYESGRKFEGAKKLNLIGNHNDPTMSREKIYFDIYNSLDLPERRVSFAKIYINNFYYGLYSLTEEYDDVFLRNRYGDDSGNLYKCVYGSNFEYNGEGQAAYSSYELLNNESANDKSDLINLTNVLENTPIADLPCELEKIFNVDQFLKIYALDISTGHWDNYGANQNNFYLYHNNFTGQLEFLSYDCDNVLGVDWFGIDWTERDVYEWNFDDRPMVEKLMQIDEYRNRFSYYLNYIASIAMHPDVLNPYIDAIRELIAPAVVDDILHTFDYGYTYDDFYNGFEQNNIDDHTPYGIKNFIEARDENTLSQVELNNITPIIKYIHHYPLMPSSSDVIEITAFIEDDAAIEDVILNWSYNNVDFESTTMYDDGTHWDGVSGDGIYGNLLESMFHENETLYYYITASDNAGNMNAYPLCGVDSIYVGFSPEHIVINEFLAINTITLPDENNVYSDYIELFNPTAANIYLGDKYLSDEFDRPGKFKMPDVILYAGAYALFYADDNPEAGIFHCNFKLDGDKDEIGIFSGPEYYYAIIDTVSFTNQIADQSIGRIPNGSGPFVELDEASPNQNNEVIIPPIDTAFEQQLLIYGNPASNTTTLIMGLTSLTSVVLDLVNLNGQVVFRIEESIKGEGSYIYPIDISHLASGVYFFRLTADDKVSAHKFVVF